MSSVTPVARTRSLLLNASRSSIRAESVATPLMAQIQKPRKRYKLFSEETLRNVVLNRLRRQLFAAGFCPPDARVVLGLAAGKIYGDEE